MRLRVLAAVAAIAVVTPLLATTPALAYCPDGPCGGGSTGWAKGDAFDYAYHGLRERYVFGGAKGWINNNTWDASSTEGVDCSEYIRRVWAVDGYVGEHASTGHPYSTLTFYNIQVPNTKRVSSTNMSDGNMYSDPMMTAWVYRSDKDPEAPGNHMGAFWYETSTGVWATLEARGADYGIVSVNRALSTLNRYGYRRIEKTNWARY